MLFPIKDRRDTGPKTHSETDWEYLDRSGRVEAERVRALLHQWVSEFPAEHRTEITARLREAEDIVFQAAAFELLVYRSLKLLGCEVTVHPEVSTGGRRPDFLLATPAGEMAFVEATVASEFDRTTQAARRRTAVALDAVEKVSSPDFFLAVTADGDPVRPPNGRQLRAQLRAWLETLDYDAVSAAVIHGGAAPQFEWVCDGWKIQFEASPKKPDRRGLGQRTIGANFSDVRWNTAHEALREAIKAKGGRYGQLPHPLLVAVNVDATSIEQDNEMEALFGDEQVVLNMADRAAPPKLSRAANGAWFGPTGPQYTRMSGAWLFRRVCPWNFTQRAHTVYFNPFATISLPAIFESLPHAKANGDTLQWSAGRKLHELLGVSVNWPEED